MSKQHLSLKPKSINRNAWWYEENGGINVVVQHTTQSGEYIKTVQYKIPWSKVREALKRKDRK